MHSTFAIGSHDSPAPGIIPGPVRVHDQPARLTRRAGRPPPRRATKPFASPGQGNPVSIVLARLMGVIRGDAYTVVAYPPASGSIRLPAMATGWSGRATTVRCARALDRPRHRSQVRPRAARGQSSQR